MKRQLSFVVLAALGAFALVVLSGVPLPYATQAQAQSSPSVAVSLSSDTVEEGATIAVTMSFSGLESDADTDTKDYVFRADVVGADECEDQAGGYGLGVDRYIHQVDEDPETRTGTISADCPAGDYIVEAVLNAPDETRLESARASFTVAAPAPEPTPDQEDPDPSVALALSPAGFAPWNTEISVTTLFGGLKADSDRDTTDYVFRADVVDADACEGDGLGIDRYMYQVDEDPETRSGTIAAGCPIGGYTIEASIATEADGVVASTSTEFSILGPSIGLAIPATEQGAGGVLTLIFGFLAPDADADTTDYIFRADVVDADACEGDGLGVDRYMYQVDEDPETHTGTISADCPAGDYTLEVSISTPDGAELASARASFSVAEPEEEEDDPPDSAEQQAAPALQAKVLVTGTVYEPQGGVIVGVRVRTDSYAEPQGSLTLTVQTFPDSAGSWTDYIPFTATVTFKPADFFGYYDSDSDSGFYEAIKQVARFRIVDDNTPEDDQRLGIALTKSSSAPASATTQGATVTIKDGDELRSPTSNRQPRLRYAVYDADADEDAVVLRWAAGSDTQGLTGYRIDRSAPGGATELTHADLRGDDRPAVGSDVLTWKDTTVPASSLVLYRVWAVFSDGSEVASYAFPATMDRGIVRARITVEGSNDRVAVSWTDAAYPLGDGSLHYGVCSEGYKVYQQINTGGFLSWHEISAADKDPAARTYLGTGTNTSLTAGDTIPFRIRCGGDSETTGLLIGEDTATVQ